MIRVSSNAPPFLPLSLSFSFGHFFHYFEAPGIDLIDQAWSWLHCEPGEVMASSAPSGSSNSPCLLVTQGQRNGPGKSRMQQLDALLPNVGVLVLSNMFGLANMS